jgi:hypothetical protein
VPVPVPVPVPCFALLRTPTSAKQAQARQGAANSGFWLYLSDRPTVRAGDLHLFYGVGASYRTNEYSTPYGGQRHPSIPVTVVLEVD